MKKLHFLLATAIILSFSACKKSDDTTAPAYTCTTCVTTPTAKAVNDGSSKGIYKGVVIGSSGTIVFDISNNGTTITAIMVIDGITVNLTAAVAWVPGQPYVSDFTGTLSGQPVTIHFTVGATGSTPTVTSSNIPGHPNASLDIIKETSGGLVECFEGTYHTTKPEDGTINIILSRTLSTWLGFARPNGATTSGAAGTGTISNNKLIDPSQNNTSISTLSGDNLNGSFVDQNGRTVTITGRRTY
jgi:hypothetical protein